MTAPNGIHFELGVRNISALVANLHAADEEIQLALRAAAHSAAELLVEVVQQTCAVDTGFMRDHVRAWFTPSGLGFEVGWDAGEFFEAGLAFYPWFVEFGTRYMAAQPSLLPGYDYVVPIYQEDIADLVRLAIARRSI